MQVLTEKGVKVRIVPRFEYASYVHKDKKETYLLINPDIFSAPLAAYFFHAVTRLVFILEIEIRLNHFEYLVENETLSIYRSRCFDFIECVLLEVS